jgi:hypothetical protein
MCPRFAENTSVPADRSRAEIERILARYGATNFMYGWDEGQAVIIFRMGTDYGHRQVRFILTMPDRNDREFTHTPTRGNRRSPAQIEEAWEQAIRQRWRALALVVKAKLEAVESGIATFDQEFLSHILLPDGQTVGEFLHEDLERAYTDNVMPPPIRALLPAASGA